VNCRVQRCLASQHGEKQERWRDVGESDMRGHITEWRRFWSRPVPGSHKELICLALPIRVQPYCRSGERQHEDRSRFSWRLRAGQFTNQDLNHFPTLIFGLYCAFWQEKRIIGIEPWREHNGTIFRGKYGTPRLTMLRQCEIGFAFHLVNVEQSGSPTDATGESFC
jgi:hypothetical protein